MNTQQELADRFDEFRTAHLRVYPPPTLSRLESFDYKKIVVAMFFILNLTIYAATRTARVIIETELAAGYSTSSSTWLGAAATIGFEGMILFMSITRTRKDVLHTQSHAGVLITIGGIISALAGISSGMGLIDESQTILKAIGGLNVTLALVLGVGATVMVWASGEFVGTAIHNHRVEAARRVLNHRMALDTYEQNLRTAWDKSDERALLMHSVELTRARQQAELEVLARQAQYDSKFANTHREKGVDLLGRTAVSHKPLANSLQLSQSDMAYNWLASHPESRTWQLLEHVPSAREIATALGEEYGKDFSTGSTTRGRDRYTKENHLNGQA